MIDGTRRENRFIAAFLGLLGTFVLATASPSEGFTRDEGYYFEAAELHEAFYEEAASGLVHGSAAAFSQNTVDRYFSYNHEHPPLMKTLFGLSWRLFHKCNCVAQPGRHPLGYPRAHFTLELLSESAALRLPAHVFGGLLVALVFLFGAHAFSRRAGLVAALLTLFTPRYFFDAQLACFDAPVATTWMLTVYCYYRSLDDRRYALPAGLAFGLALATKHNAFFIPILLVGHYLWVRRDRLRALSFPPIPAAFVYMATVGPLLYVLLWPWLWFHPVARFQEYVGFHLHHVFYNFEYLGRNYNKAPSPRSFTLVMTLLTTPVTTLALSFLGLLSLFVGPLLRSKHQLAIDVARQKGQPPPPPVFVWQPAVVGMIERGAGGRLRNDPGTGTVAQGLSTAPALLIAMNALFALAIITLTGAPIFGGTKHWHAAVPFIALLAGVGAAFLCDLAERVYPPRASDPGKAGRDLLPSRAFAAVLLLCTLPAAAETARSHPYGLSFYNMLAGGPAGGADLGMNRQFWGYATRGVLPWLNGHVARNGNVYWHDANQPMLNMDVREGLLRGDINNTGLEEAGVKASSTALIIHEKHFNKYEYWIWDFYGTARPSFVLTDEGVPLVTVYERPKQPQ